MLVAEWVPIKDLGLFIPANCTESRDGHNGAIPGPQNQQIQITHNEISVISARDLVCG